MNRETNRDRVLNGVNRVPQNMDVPWEPIELRQFWAMARAVGMSKESVYNLIGKMFPGKEKLHALTRDEFIRLMNDLETKGVRDQGVKNSIDRYFAGTPMEAPWRRIRWLQRQLGWGDEHLKGYIKWHGKDTARWIDHIGWLTVDKARGIITGMEKMRHSKKYRLTKEVVTGRVSQPSK